MRVFQQPPRTRRSIALPALAAVFLLAPAPALAQGSLKELYDRATERLNNKDVETACELFKQVEAQNSGFENVVSLRKAACAGADRQLLLHKAEDSLFTECRQLFNQGEYDDAKVKCQNALDKSRQLQHPRHQDEARQTLNDIDAKKDQAQQADQQRQKCNSIFQEAMTLEGQGQLADARDRFKRVAQMGCPQAGEAQRRADDLNTRIGKNKEEEARRQQTQAEQAQRLQEQEKKAEEAFNDCLRRYNAHDLSGAQGRCQDVVRLNGKRRAEAERYLTKIRTELAGEVKPVPPKPPPEGNENVLRAGLRAYLNGNYAEAETALSAYVDSHGAKHALAYFFRGAAHSSLYFLSGEKEQEQKNQALADFGTAKDQGFASQPSEKFVSPKILALYQQAGSAGPH